MCSSAQRKLKVTPNSIFWFNFPVEDEQDEDIV